MEKNNDRRKEYWAEYYKKNKPHIIQRIKEKRSEDKEEFKRKQREYRARNRERFLERERLYYQKNKPTILARKRESQRIRSRVYYWSERYAQEPTQQNAERLRQAQEALAAYLEAKREP